MRVRRSRKVIGVIDGIQPSARVACWRQGRPVGLFCVAAGCTDPRTGTVIAREERLLLAANGDEGVVAHNLCVLISCIHELGMEVPEFGAATAAVSA